MTCPVCDDAGIVIARPATEPVTFGAVADCPRCAGIPTLDIRKVTT